MTDIHQIADTLESLPSVLGAVLSPIDQKALARRPEAGEWSPLEVIGHLIACDSSAFRDRIDAIVSGDPDIAGFDPWKAINERDFAVESLEVLLDELTDERKLSAELVRGLTSTELARSATFHDGRRFEANDFVHEWPFHDHEHVQQILDALKLTYLPHMTPTMRDALTSQS